MTAWNRCLWTMPNDSNLGSGSRCVKESEHGHVHVIATPHGDAITYWEIKPRTRTAKMIVHVDLRDGSTVSDEECLALYQSFRRAA